MVWNADAETMFGHRADAVVGRPVDVIIPGAVPQGALAGIPRAMAALEIKDMAADMPVFCADRE